MIKYFYVSSIITQNKEDFYFKIWQFNNNTFITIKKNEKLKIRFCEASTTGKRYGINLFRRCSLRFKKLAVNKQITNKT